MPVNQPAREIQFDSVLNFRDLGGYPTVDGRETKWRRIFRSAELRHISAAEVERLRSELGVASVIDLRLKGEIVEQGVGLLKGCGIQYHNVPFAINEEERAANPNRFSQFSSMGQVYLFLAGHPEYGEQIVKALGIIADGGRRPLVFHCAAGKDRTGILAALLLSVLGVGDRQIVADYALSANCMPEFRRRLGPIPPREAVGLPEYTCEATESSMSYFLDSLNYQYGSSRGYLESCGATPSLFERLREGLLE